MKRVGLLGVLLVVVLCGNAQAGLAPVQFGIGYVATGPLTAAQKAAAMPIALAYWHRAPDCGIPSIEWRTPTVAEGATPEPTGSAWAQLAECKIIIRPPPPEFHGAESWPDYCVTVAHELGHLILGSTYFQAVNPADPSHSPDPHNVMYAHADPASVPACVPRSARRRSHHRVGREQRVSSPRAG